MIESLNLCLKCIHFNESDSYCNKKGKILKTIIECPYFRDINEISEEKLPFEEFMGLTPLPLPQVSEDKTYIKPKFRTIPLKLIDNMKIMFLLFLSISIIDWTRPFHYMLIYNRWDLWGVALLETIIHSILFIFVVILLIFIKFTLKGLDDLFLENGKKSKAIQNLFSEKKFYNQFSKEFYSKAFSKNILIISVIMAFLIVLFTISVFDDVISLGGQLFYWPFWGNFYIFVENLLIGTALLIIFLIFLCLIRGLSLIKSMMKKRENLAITIFLKNLKTFLFKRNTDKIIRDKNSTSYFRFQESNRNIGEFLFRVAGFLLFLGAIISGVIFAAYHLLSFSAAVQSTFITLLVFDFIFGILAIILFIYPQIEVHNFLKSYKREIVELLNLKIEEINAYFLLSFHESIDISQINPKWNNTEDLITETEMLMMYTDQIEAMGTWSYDFPEVVKLVGVALSPFAAIISTFISI